jgi:hypothetical protein
MHVKKVVFACSLIANFILLVAFLRQPKICIVNTSSKSLEGEMREEAHKHSCSGYSVGLAILPDFRPLYWTPFHEYVEKVKKCKKCPLLHKWEAYFAAYHTHFSRFRGKNVTMMEVGVQSGGSILMWRWYFGAGLRYYGIDINPKVQQFGNDWATIIIGDQSKGWCLFFFVAFLSLLSQSSFGTE